MVGTDQNKDIILSRLRAGKTERDLVIKQLYFDDELKGKIRSMVLKSGGCDNDFEIVFNTTLVQFIKTVVKNKNLTIKTSINNYILGIAKFSWYREFKNINKNKTEPIDNIYNLSTSITPESLVIDFSKKELIKKLLANLRRNCKEVLMYWANGYAMKEIADLLGYKSSNMAKKKKHLCFKELLAYLDDNPNIKSLLK